GVGGRGGGGSEVGNDLDPVRAADALEADEPVVGDDQELPFLQRVVDLRVRGAGRSCIRDRVQRAALLPPAGRGCGGVARASSAAAATSGDQSERGDAACNREATGLDHLPSFPASFPARLASLPRSPIVAGAGLFTR